MIPGTSMTRFTVVMVTTMAAIVGVALAIGDSRPLLAFGLTVVICIISSAVLPSATWVRFTDGVRQVVQARGWHMPRIPRAAVVLTVATGLYLGVVMPAFARSIPDGVAVLGGLCAASALAIWQPGRDTIRQWRDERIEEKRLSRQLTEMDAHDRKDFTGKGIPRKDWLAFLDELASMLREMRASEGREQ